VALKKKRQAQLVAKRASPKQVGRKKRTAAPKTKAIEKQYKKLSTPKLVPKRGKKQNFPLRAFLLAERSAKTSATETIHRLYEKSSNMIKEDHLIFI